MHIRRKRAEDLRTHMSTAHMPMVTKAWPTLQANAEVADGALREHCPDATIVLDRFHLVKALNATVDEIRKEEWRVINKHERNCHGFTVGFSPPLLHRLQKGHAYAQGSRDRESPNLPRLAPGG